MEDLTKELYESSTGFDDEQQDVKDVLAIERNGWTLKDDEDFPKAKEIVRTITSPGNIKGIFVLCGDANSGKTNILRMLAQRLLPFVLTSYPYQNMRIILPVKPNVT